MSGYLNDGERQTLLALARASLRSSVLGDDSLDRELEGVVLTPTLERPGAAFVTLWARGNPGDGSKGKRLRGCIGSMEAREPLYRSVIRNASNAALKDPRFPPVSSPELDRLRVEVSVLTPLRKIRGPDEIVLGRDGVELEKGSFRSVFLPQVAPEQGWDVRQTLEHLAIKAGLPADGWKGAQLSVFQAEVFEEP